MAAESGAEETVSVLYRLCAGVERVVLDPSPEAVAERPDGLVVLDRESLAARTIVEKVPGSRRNSGSKPYFNKGCTRRRGSARRPRLMNRGRRGRTTVPLSRTCSS